MSVILRYGDVLQLIERLHALPVSRGGATESRIKNFARLDFPPGPRVGSGERAMYGPAQTVQLLVAFELLRHRLPPTVIAELVRTEWSRVAVAFATAASRLLAGETPGGEGAGLLLVDTLALHEVGKVVRPGELLSTIEPIYPDDRRRLHDAHGQPAGRSDLLLDPEAILAEVASFLPNLRHPRSADEFIAKIQNLPSWRPDPSWRAYWSGRDARVGSWMEVGYSRRRALADALAALRAAPPPLIDEVVEPLRDLAARRAHAAIGNFKGPLSTPIADGARVDVLLAIYLTWATDDRSIPAADAGATLAFRTRFQTAAKLHAALLEAICSELPRLIQDL